MVWKKGESGNKATQIVKGEIRNPKGGAKGKNFRTIIKELASKEVDYTDLCSEDKRGPAGVAIVTQLYKSALLGDSKASRLLMEHAEGKKTQIEGGDEDKPIKFKMDLSGVSDEDLKRFVKNLSEGDNKTEIHK